MCAYIKLHSPTKLISREDSSNEKDQYPDMSFSRKGFENARLKTTYLSLSKQIDSIQDQNLLQMMGFKNLESEPVIARAVIVE